MTVIYDIETPVANDDFKDDQIPGKSVTLSIINNDSPRKGIHLDPATIDLIKTIDDTNVQSNCLNTDADGRCIELEVPGEGTWTAHDDGTATFTSKDRYKEDPRSVIYTIEDQTK